MEMAQIIISLREQNNLTQEEFGKIVGVSGKAVSTWENGTRIPRMGAIQRMADYFGVKKSDIIGDTEPVTSKPTEVPPGFMPLPETSKVPLVGRIACGQPITAEENIEDYLDVPVGHHVDFALLCEGDSMVDAGIDDGDVVYIRKQPDVENGQIAAVRIDNEATLKRVYKYVDRIVLQPENRAYPPLTYVGAEMNQVTIEGKAVGWLHWV